MEEEAQKKREEARGEVTTQEGVSKKNARTDKTDTEMDICTEAGGEVGTSQSQSKHKKGHMTHIYLMELDEEGILDFEKDHVELYNQTNEHFKDKARKECLWEWFANSPNLSVKVCKIWFELQRICCSKFKQSKSGQAPNEMTERQNWIQDKFHFLKSHIRCKGLRLQVPGSRSQCFSTQHLQIFNQHGQYGDQHATRHHNKAFRYKPRCSFSTFFGQLTGHRLDHTGEHCAANIHWAKTGDNRKSLLSLPGFGGGGLKR